MNLLRNVVFSLFISYCVSAGFQQLLSSMPPVPRPTLTPESYVCFAPPSSLLGVLREGTALDSLPDSSTTMNLKYLRMLVMNN